MGKNYKIYIHLFPHGKRYIGMTRQRPEKRWANGRGYENNKHMINAIKKYGWNNVRHTIVYKGLSRSEAENKEKELIQKYKSNDSTYGYNIANGGNSKGSVSEETKQKLSDIRMGEKNPMYGLYGKKHHNAIKVNQYDLQGVFIKTWDCSADAERKLNVAKTKIIATCKGKRKSTGGYQWRYFEGSINNILPYKIMGRNGKDNPMYGVKGKDNSRSKRVFQYTLNKELINEYESASEAQAKTGISLQNITSCCRMERKTSCGYIWEYA